jgi:hypothetical protein
MCRLARIAAITPSTRLRFSSMPEGFHRVHRGQKAFCWGILVQRSFSNALASTPSIADTPTQTFETISCVRLAFS